MRIVMMMIAAISSTAITTVTMMMITGGFLSPIRKQKCIQYTLQLHIIILSQRLRDLTFWYKVLA